MRTVTRFESNLLRILHSFLDQSDVSHVISVIKKPEKRPACLTRDAVELVKQSLGVGTVTLLAREGGWAQQRHLREGQPRDGNVWQRTAPEELGLSFSPASLDFLMWITAADATIEMPLWVVQQSEPMTFGDQFLISCAARSLRDTPLFSRWYRSPLFQRNALIGLMHSERFAAVDSLPAPEFDPWMSGVGSSILEAVQDSLARHWVATERHKRKIEDTKLMIRLGKAQQAALNALFDAAESHGRRDLCRFVMQASHELLGGTVQAADWIGRLSLEGRRLADRTAVFEQATAFLRATRRLQRWHREGQTIGYFDEGYAESQWLKSSWEAHQMDAAIQQAERVTGELEF